MNLHDTPMRAKSKKNNITLFKGVNVTQVLEIY